MDDTIYLMWHVRATFLLVLGEGEGHFPESLLSIELTDVCDRVNIQTTCVKAIVGAYSADQIGSASFIRRKYANWSGDSNAVKPREDGVRVMNTFLASFTAIKCVRTHTLKSKDLHAINHMKLLSVRMERLRHIFYLWTFVNMSNKNSVMETNKV